MAAARFVAAGAETDGGLDVERPRPQGDGVDKGLGGEGAIIVETFDIDGGAGA